jgi:predicted Na+-dependent transporter
MDMQFWEHLITRICEVLVHATFPVVVLIISSRVTFPDLAGEFRRPWFLLRAFAATGIIVPLITAGVVKAFGIPLLVGGIMLIAGVSPGDSFALLEAKGKKGSVNLAAATMSILCLVMPLTVPLWLWVLGKWFPLHFRVSSLDLFAVVAPATILPLLAGVSLHSFFPSFTKILQRVLEWFFRIAISFLGIVGLIVGFKDFSKLTATSYACIFVVVSLAIIVGYYTGGSFRKDRISLGLTASLGNLAAVLLITHMSYPNVHVIGTVVVFVLFRWVTIMLWYLFLRLRLHVRGEKLYD